MLLRNVVFPTLPDVRPIKWVLIHLEPIAGSGERLLIGVAAVSDGAAVVKRVGLKKLECLFGEAAFSLSRTCDVVLAAIGEDLKARGAQALEEPKAIMSGVYFSPPFDAQAESPEALAEKWLMSLSSLADYSPLQEAENEDVLPEGEVVTDSASPLPKLVHDAVMGRAPDLSRFFRQDLRPNILRERRPRLRPFDVRVDFTGNRIVANIGSLTSSRPTYLSRGLKQKLWDLDAFRGRRSGQPSLAFADGRGHELLLLRPENAGLRGTSEMDDMLGALVAQADPLEIRVRPLSTIDVIASHILVAEDRSAASALS